MDYDWFTPAAPLDQSNFLGDTVLMQALSANPKDNATPDLNGICSGLCATWIALMMQNAKSSPKELMRTLGSNAGIKFGSRSHNFAEQRVSGVSAYKEIKAMCDNKYGAFGLKVADDGVYHSNVRAEVAKGERGVRDVAGWLAGHVGRNRKVTLVYLGLTVNGKSAAHVVSTYKSGGFVLSGHINFFDPNAGQFVQPAIDLIDLLTSMINSYERIGMPIHEVIPLSIVKK